MAKSIVDKLNLHKFKQTAVLNEPAGSGYFAELTGYDREMKDYEYDLIFDFVLDMDALRQSVDYVIANHKLQMGGYLFAAYPKMGNKVYPTYIHRDDLFEGVGSDADGYVGASDVKFARMVGLDDVFTVVGFKRESREKSKTANASKASQRAEDYIALIPSIEQDLADNSELLAFYQSLTPGYQKDWARYIYSAKQEETKDKRRDEMKLILQSGYKSRELYRQDQR
jgi:hypothetical protein